MESIIAYAQGREIKLIWKDDRYQVEGGVSDPIDADIESALLAVQKGRCKAFVDPITESI